MHESMCSEIYLYIACPSVDIGKTNSPAYPLTAPYANKFPLLIPKKCLSISLQLRHIPLFNNHRPLFK